MFAWALRTRMQARFLVFGNAQCPPYGFDCLRFPKKIEVAIVELSQLHNRHRSPRKTSMYGVTLLRVGSRTLDKCGEMVARRKASAPQAN
jgi:hypothetical protein